ncbi:MAG: TonB-dependent receptor plug domain-containing protein, partial [bacterium]
MYKFIWCGAIIAIQFVAGLVFAAEIEGVIIDRKTHEPVIGAAIKIAESGKGAKSRLDGSFKIHGVGDGPATIKVTRLGYVEFDTVVQARSGDYDITLNIELSPTVVHGREVDINAHAEHGSDIEAQKTERNSDNVISAVSARTIEVSPDLSVANVSQRLSGVTVTRSSSNGDGQYAIIRGMEKRYNYTTVNGVKIPSPDNKNRYVPLDIFPSELLDRLEVTKSLLPTMEGDAIGGAMNLVMKQAPDHFIATGKVGTGYNGLFFDRKVYTVDLVKNETSPRLVHPGAV